MLNGRLTRQGKVPVLLWSGETSGKPFSVELKRPVTGEWLSHDRVVSLS